MYIDLRGNFHGLPLLAFIILRKIHWHPSRKNIIIHLKPTKGSNRGYQWYNKINLYHYIDTTIFHLQSNTNHSTRSYNTTSQQKKTTPHTNIQNNKLSITTKKCLLKRDTCKKHIDAQHVANDATSEGTNTLLKWDMLMHKNKL